MANLETKSTDGKKKKSKKRIKADLDGFHKAKHAISTCEALEADAELDMNGPTMEEKLASLELHSKISEKNATDPRAVNIPSADSVHVLLKQAIHAQDHTLLVDCLSTSDEKIITKSTALLNPSDVLKLLKSLISMVELRGAILIVVLPWLRSLLSQHASSIASQEASLLVLHSLYQLIESRTSTYQTALQLSTSLDCLFAMISEGDDESSFPVAIYEDKDSDDEEESEDLMEVDDESEGLGDVIDSPHSFDGTAATSD